MDLKKNGFKKIAWGITGASHLLKESVEVIQSLITSKYNIDVYFSKAAKEVVTMFGQMTSLNKLRNNYKNSIHFVFGSRQGWSYPICGKFSQKYYDTVIISPTTANTVAKISYRISDSLITNIVSQSLKGLVPVIIIPTDFKAGLCKTVAPGNREIEIIIHESDVERTDALRKIKGITVLESPDQIKF
ncbi:MAG: hypothetical protein GF364_00300 [Candidatus Lokiarchaeota archaeon]|nr:hypothetical protein [Candidatus Lokiarchaeota archaeon]